MLDNDQPAHASGTITDATPGIANMSVKGRASPSLASGSRTVHHPTGAADGKGVKGEEASAPQPLPPLSNPAFLAAVVRDVPADATAAICSKSGDPTKGAWDAERPFNLADQCPPDRNNYVNCSSFVAKGQAVQARKDDFAAFHMLVLDDVGTKVDRTRLNGMVPTWEIETSPGNSQIGFRLADPLRDLVQVKLLQDAAIAAGLSDPGRAGRRAGCACRTRSTARRSTAERTASRSPAGSCRGRRQRLSPSTSCSPGLA